MATNEYPRLSPVTIENAKIIFRNFSGAETQYNRAGDRNFCVVIDSEETAHQMLADGWNVKQSKPRDEDDDVYYYLQIKVKFGSYPPEIHLLTTDRDNIIGEDLVGTLDRANIENVDLIFSPYRWTLKNGDTGIKAYLQEMYVTIRESPLARKYANMYHGE